MNEIVITLEPGLETTSQNSEVQEDVEYTILDCPPGLQCLVPQTSIVIRECLKLFGAFTGSETNKIYEILNASDQRMYFAKETTGTFTRCFFGTCRPFSLVFYNNARRIVMYMKRFGGCLSDEIVVTTDTGELIGKVVQNNLCINRTYSIVDARGESFLKVNAPSALCFVSNYTHDFPLMSGEIQVGRITKNWSGHLQEHLTNADSFGTELPADLSPQMKAVVMACTFLIDFDFYEK